LNDNLANILITMREELDIAKSLLASVADLFSRLQFQIAINRMVVIRNRARKVTDLAQSFIEAYDNAQV